MADSSTERKIWNYLKSKGLNDFGAAGLMGNLFAESGLNPRNLQNSYEKKLGYTDDTYTAAVDSGAYSNFVKDSAGYGLAQWTYWTRKAALLDYVRSVGKSVGDLDAQLDYLYKELSENYATVLNVLKTAESVWQASDEVLLKFERPADQSAAVQTKRASYGLSYYDKYAKEAVTMSNSSLVSYTKISPNKTSPRDHAIDTITIHCMAGNLTVETCGNVFAPTSRQASSNYGIGSDGRIAMYVEEKDRSWCTSNRANDMRAVTIEVANDGGADTGWHVSDKALASLVKLCADICKRNGIRRLVWTKNKSDRMNHKNGANMTVHRDYAAKSCPGDYLYNLHGWIAQEVNKILGSASGSEDTHEPVQNGELYRVRKSWKDSKSQIGAYKNLKNAKAECDKHPGYAVFNSKGEQVYPATVVSFKQYTVMITASELNVRKGPGTNYGIVTTVRKGEIYTIVAEAKNGGTVWGKLKSGAGYICLSYTTRK